MTKTTINKDIKNSYNGLKMRDCGFLDIADEAKICESYMDMLLRLTNDGVIGIDSEGFIKYFNTEAENILKIKTMAVLNKNAFELFDGIPFKEVLTIKESITNVVAKYNESSMIISVAPVFYSGNIYGALAILKKYPDSEEEQIEIMDKGHIAKYTFRDIIGISNEIIKCKSIAENMAKSNSSVLITGESGTGKELFAQSIHNSSYRKNAPFVAINCGALPDNLLESELFGYVEGAFTGAKKKGKQGLFEMAQNGTIFLDEIGEMPMHLQLKLLRVIQEREIMRIGGDNIIKLDIRIIAATNKNLEKLIDNNQFRVDLYYRLNVLPLKVPPLRNRREDIIPLFDYMKHNLGGTFKLSDEAQAKIESYNWKGNVRELQNIVEYLCNLNYKLVNYDEVPISDYTKNDTKISINERDRELINKLFVSVDGDIEKYIFVLSELESNIKNNVGLGRRTIYKNALLKEIYLSESKIRRIITDLSDLNMIRVAKGRGGCHITDFGLKTLSYLKSFIAHNLAF